MSAKFKALICTALVMAASSLVPVAQSQSGVTAGSGTDDIASTAVKRYYLAQVNSYCHILDTPADMALKAGFLQARNEALRSGYTMASLSPWLDKARDAAARTDCTSTALTAEMRLAQGAYDRFIAVPHMDLATDRATWRADRSFGDKDAWRLVQFQSVPGADLAMGLYGSLGQKTLSVMVSFKDGVQPYSARLLLRDPNITPNGVINRSPYGLTRTLPTGFTEATSVSIMARDSRHMSVEMRPHVTANMAGFNLTGAYVGAQGPQDAIRYDFPTRAYSDIARLDPREDIVVVFECADGPLYARFEVGDFMTGLTYLALPSPYGGAKAS
jgi:hypothetical protein